jgi:hypothetical protein
MRWSTLAPLLSGKETPVPITYQAKWTPEPVRHGGEEKNDFPPFSAQANIVWSIIITTPYDFITKITDNFTVCNHYCLTRFLWLILWSRQSPHSVWSKLSATWVSYHYGMAHSQVVVGGDGLQIWRVAAIILNKQTRIADKGGSPAYGSGVQLTNPRCTN